MSQAIKDIGQNGNYTLTGPLSSFGNGIYHGAFYYYLFKIPGILVNYNPVGLAATSAIFSIISVWLLYESVKNSNEKHKKSLVCNLIYYLSKQIK